MRFQPAHALHRPSLAPRSAAPTSAHRSGPADGEAHYLEFFDCFNAGRYFEAHEVLETLWLPQRKGPDAAFYQGLIQLAGAFVHVRKGRLPPARALLRRAWWHLEPYAPEHRGVRLADVAELVERWLAILEEAPEVSGLGHGAALRTGPV